MPKQELFTAIAQHIDHEIHRHYRLYDINLVAAGMDKDDKHVAEFNTYVESQLRKVELEEPDMPFLREKIRQMYANPAINKAKADNQ